MSTNQNTITINKIFDNGFYFLGNITTEQRGEIETLFVAYLICLKKDISTTEKLMDELNENFDYINQVAGISTDLSFEEVKYKLNELLKREYCGVSKEDFEPIKRMFESRDARKGNKIIPLFPEQSTQNYVDSSANYVEYKKKDKRSNRFKLYMTEKISNFIDLPPRNFKRNSVVKLGVVIALSVAFVASLAGISEMNQIENQKNNVCIEYEINYGDTMYELKKVYGLRDIGISHFEIKGEQRKKAAYSLNQDIDDFIAVGDVIVARGTKENIEKLVEKGGIMISAEEAVALLQEDNLFQKNDQLKGEFAKFAKGESDFVFFILEDKKSIA